MVAAGRARDSHRRLLPSRHGDEANVNAPGVLTLARVQIHVQVRVSSQYVDNDYRIMLPSEYRNPPKAR